jgi:hypothetical protein
MLKTMVSNRKKGYIFVNADGDKLSMTWFKDRINHYAKLLGIQKDVKYYDTRIGEIHPRHLVTCMALKQARSITIMRVRAGSYTMAVTVSVRQPTNLSFVTSKD